MTHQDFCYWLQGYVEVNGGKIPDEAGWQVIKDHLQLVFNKVTPLQVYESKFEPIDRSIGGIALNKDFRPCSNSDITKLPFTETLSPTYCSASSC